MIEFAPVLRMLGALGIVLGLLWAALWVVRRYRITLPGGLASSAWSGRNDRRLEIVERLSLDQKRSVIILRADEREYLLTLAGDGAVLLDSSEASEAPQREGDEPVGGAVIPFRQFLAKAMPDVMPNPLRRRAGATK